MISLHYNTNGVFVYNPDEWATLRKRYRIIGELVGNTNFIPKLPLKLQPEEALLLLEDKIAQIWKDTKVKSALGKTSANDYFEKRLVEEQKIIYKEDRKRQLDHFKDNIVNAKRKKGDIRPAEVILEEELGRSCQVTEEKLIWPILNEPVDSIRDVEEVSKEEILTHTTELKSRVFRDLWQRGYYITTGHKFGGDYLVYIGIRTLYSKYHLQHGDPIAYHAIFIVRCVEDPSCINAAEIVAFGRLGTSVKKRAVLASNKDDRISYITINWIDA